MQKKSNTSRRNFIKTSSKTVALVALGSSSISSILIACNNTKIITKTNRFNTNFNQQPLPYAYTALEDVIDAKTMEIHYSKHAAAYSKNATEAATAEAVDITKPLENVLIKISKYSTKMRNNAGGHYNHEMFWKCMQPKTDDNIPTGSMQTAIEKTFGSFDAFKKQFEDAAKTRFGSGWAWLYVDEKSVLKIGSTPNQDNPLMDVAEIRGYPLLCIDVWEHAYYLKYQNKRADYIQNWWKIVNWKYVQQRFELV
ncbi:MAG: superoxide dismutase [Ferruginibacter sp.]|nr:superoxide dismutase [Ferruginibacter sp.]